jgi:diacylglycerol kinase family enzyme
MRVLILHSERAGQGRLSKAGLIRAFERAGHEVRYRSVHKPRWMLHLPKADVIVVAGGDGTVAKVAIALAKRGRKAPPPPLAVIPAGKANNIARALRVTNSPATLARALDEAPSTRLAIGLIRGPWGQARFVESAGIGPLASLFRTELSTLRAALCFLRDEFRKECTRTLRVRADRHDLTGEYVLVHAMNIEAAGPRLVYAPQANPGDDRLDLVLLQESERPAFTRYLDRLVAGKRARCPVVPIRARRVEIAPWPTRDGGHIDDKLWPKEKRPKQGRVRIEVETTISVLVPRA